MLWRPIPLVVLFPFLSLHTFFPVAGGPVQKVGLTVPEKYKHLKDEVGNMFVESYAAYQLRERLSRLLVLSLNDTLTGNLLLDTIIWHPYQKGLWILVMDGASLLSTR
jgi:hypothetical protein